MRALQKPVRILILSVCVYAMLLISHVFETNEFPYENVDDIRFFDEWTPLGKNFLLRRPSAFYFHDENLLTVLAIVNQEFDITSVSCTLNRRMKSKAKFVYLHAYFDVYKAYAVECVFDNSAIGLHETLKLSLNDTNNVLRTKAPIDVSIKSSKLKKSVIKTDGDYLLCTDYVYMETKDFENLEKWIEYNKQIGFEKIVIYNSSIPNGPDFVRLFQQYKDFIEIRNYKYFASLDNKYTYMLKLDKPQNDFDHLHQRIATNECYMSYRTYFKKIVVIDTDELILPQVLSNAQTTAHDNIECRKQNKTELEFYFNELNQMAAYKNSNSFWFPYAQSIYKDDVDKINLQLDNLVHANYSDSLNERIVLGKGMIPKFFNLVFRIKNQGDLSYARLLRNLYENLTGMYSSPDKSVFSSFVSIFVDAHPVYTGKSLHLTEHVRYVDMHFALFVNSTRIKKEHGFVTHFRKKMKTSPGVDVIELAIKDLFLNAYYLKCFAGKNIQTI